MIWVLAIISLITSIFLFHIGVIWLALLPLLVSMYMLFTDGQLPTQKAQWQFSRYHVLFGLRCSLMIWCGLLLHVLDYPMMTIFACLMGIHMLVIWLTLLGKYEDELTMFHIWYYFIMFLLARYLPLTYGWQEGSAAFLFFPIISFLLYACGSFFIHPFVPLPVTWHYRTAMTFLLSFLSSVILYFFSSPLLGRAAAAVLLVSIIRFFVHQQRNYIAFERKRYVGAEDILAGSLVIQESPSVWHATQTSLMQLLQGVPTYRRRIVPRSSTILCAWALISAFLGHTVFSPLVTFLLLVAAYGMYLASLRWWHILSYTTTWPDALVWLYGHAIFLWMLRSYFGTNFQTSVFLAMARTLMALSACIFAAQQARHRTWSRKYPLMYGLCGSSILVWGIVMLFFSQLGLESGFVRAINVLFGGIMGTLVYFFARAWNPMQKQY